MTTEQFAAEVKTARAVSQLTQEHTAVKRHCKRCGKGTYEWHAYNNCSVLKCGRCGHNQGVRKDATDAKKLRRKRKQWRRTPVYVWKFQVPQEVAVDWIKQEVTIICEKKMIANEIMVTTMLAKGKP